MHFGNEATVSKNQGNSFREQAVSQPDQDNESEPGDGIGSSQKSDQERASLDAEHQ